LARNDKEDAMAATEPGFMPREVTRSIMTRRGRVVVLIAACFVASTFAFVPRQQSPRDESLSGNAQNVLVAAELTTPSRTPRRVPGTTSPDRARDASASAVVRDLPLEESAASVTTLPLSFKSDYTTIVTAPAPREQEISAVTPSLVTLSGCLEQGDEGLRLKETAGADAPRSRNWRSGFLRRNASAIDVVDESNRLHLPTYIGQRVSVKGTLVDREMQVQSVAIVAESCEER
jgi:hypothetical protein